MKKYKVYYKILDCFGDVIRISSYKPSKEYKFVKVKELLYNVYELEEALF